MTSSVKLPRFGAELEIEISKQIKYYFPLKNLKVGSISKIICESFQVRLG